MKKRQRSQTASYSIVTVGKISITGPSQIFLNGNKTPAILSSFKDLTKAAVKILIYRLYS